MPNLKVIVQYDDVKLNSTAKVQKAVLYVDNIISATSNPSALISTDPNNDLKLGSDNKLMVATDELNTSFEYAASIAAFWSI